MRSVPTESAGRSTDYVGQYSFEAAMHSAIRFLVIAMALAPASHASPQAVEPTEESLRVYAVHVSGGLYGVYLGHGVIITAAHVIGSTNSPSVRIGGLNMSSKVIKLSPFDQLDLALLSVDEEKLPVSLRLRRMPLCEKPPYAGEPVVVAIPESIARSQIMSPLSLPPDVRRFSTVIKDVASTGNSGSGVFDANGKCLIGIMSRKIFSRSSGGGKDKDLAKYFVPAPVIRAFIPSEYRF